MKRSSIGWIEIILGLLLVGLGIYTLANPDTALTAIVIAYGIGAIVSGIADFVIYYKLSQRGGLGSAMLILSGVLNLIVGVLMLLNIGAGAWTLSILFPLWFILHCFARLANLDFVRRLGSAFEYWVALIANVLGVILGFLILFNPFASMTALVYFVAFYLLISGFSSVIVGFGRFGRGNLV